MKSFFLAAFLAISSAAAFCQAPQKASTNKSFTMTLTVGSYIYIQNIENQAISDFTQDALGGTYQVSTSATFSILSNSPNGYEVMNSADSYVVPASFSLLQIPCSLTTGSPTGLTVDAYAETLNYTGHETAADFWGIIFKDSATYQAPAASTSTWTATFTVTNKT